MLYYTMPKFNALGCNVNPLSWKGVARAERVTGYATNAPTPAKIPLLHGGVDARSADGVVERRWSKLGY